MIRGHFHFRPFFPCNAASCSRIEQCLFMSSSVRILLSKRSIIRLPLGRHVAKIRFTSVWETGISRLHCLTESTACWTAVLCFSPRPRASSYAHMTIAARPNCQASIMSPFFRGLPLCLFSICMVPCSKLSVTVRTGQAAKCPYQSLVQPTCAPACTTPFLTHSHSLFIRYYLLKSSQVKRDLNALSERPPGDTIF